MHATGIPQSKREVTGHASVHKGWRAVLILLPAIAVIAVILGAVVSAGQSRCANGFGCGGLRNVGEMPITVTAYDVRELGTVDYDIEPGARDILIGTTNEVVVPRSCLTLDRGPFWTDRIVVQSTQEQTAVHVDSWGGRAILSPGPCPDRT